ISKRDWSSDVCSSDLIVHPLGKSFAQGSQAVLRKHLLDAVQKADVPVGAQQGGTDFPVVEQNGKDILDERKTVFVEWTDRMGPDGVQDFIEQLVLHAFQHIVDVGVVQIEGGTVDVHQVHQLFDGHLVDTFLGHQLGKTMPQQRLGAADAPVRLL